MRSEDGGSALQTTDNSHQFHSPQPSDVSSSSSFQTANLLLKEEEEEAEEAEKAEEAKAEGLRYRNAE